MFTEYLCCGIISFLYFCSVLLEMHTRMQDFGSFSTDLLSDLKLIEQQQNKVNILSVAIAWLDSIYSGAPQNASYCELYCVMYHWRLPVLGLTQPCCNHLSVQNQHKNIKWSRGDSCWIHFSKYVWSPFVSIIESIAFYVGADRWNGLWPPTDVMMNCLACPSQALDRILFSLQTKTAGQRPGNAPTDKDQMVSRFVHLCVMVHSIFLRSWNLVTGSDMTFTKFHLYIGKIQMDGCFMAVSAVSSSLHVRAHWEPVYVAQCFSDNIVMTPKTGQLANNHFIIWNHGLKQL